MMETEDDVQSQRKNWICLVGMVIAIVGILAMAKINDIREKDIVRKMREVEDREAAARIEVDACWKGFKARLEEVIRFRCPRQP